MISLESAGGFFENLHHILGVFQLETGESTSIFISRNEADIEPQIWANQIPT